MHRDTTPLQVARAVGVWLFGFGLLLLPTLVIQILHLTLPGVAATAAALLFGGGAVYFGALWALRRADAANRPVLMSARGHEVLRGREEFEKRVVQVRRWCSRSSSWRDRRSSSPSRSTAAGRAWTGCAAGRG